MVRAERDCVHPLARSRRQDFPALQRAGGWDPRSRAGEMPLRKRLAPVVEIQLACGCRRARTLARSGCIANAEKPGRSGTLRRLSALLRLEPRFLERAAPRLQLLLEESRHLFGRRT